MNTDNPSVILLTVGTELLTGKTLDTNAWFLARFCDHASFPVLKHLTVHDRKDDILDALRSAVREASVVIVTGGLGPTFDDITAECIALFAKAPFRVDTKIFNQLKQRSKSKSPCIVELLRRQASLPADCEVLKNSVGVACGFILKTGQSYIAALPGVPREMEEMSERELLPKLNQRFPNRISYEHLVVRIKGLSEPRVVSLLPRHFFTHSDLRWGIYPMNGTVGIRVYFQQKHRSVAKKAIGHLKLKLKKYIFAETDSSLEEMIAEQLIKKNKTVSVAESITAGGIGETLTRIPGSSRYFVGGVLAYSNEIKKKLLGIDAETLQKSGAVSKFVAVSMAKNIRGLTGTDYSISVSGIAGPGGGTRQKPVGLVHIAVASAKHVRHKAFYFQGDRTRIRQRTIVSALAMLFDFLKEK